MTRMTARLALAAAGLWSAAAQPADTERHCVGLCQRGTTAPYVKRMMDHMNDEVTKVNERDAELERLGRSPVLPVAATPCVDGDAGGFRCNGIDLLSRVPRTTLGAGGSDVWGWTDPTSSREYVISLLRDRTVFVDVTNAQEPVVLATMFSEGRRSSTWHDVKVFENTAYVVADGNSIHGVQVFDLERLRDMSGPAVEVLPDFVYKEHGSSHNIVINEDTGFAYSVGSNTCLGGLHVIDLNANRLRPSFVGCISENLDDDPSNDSDRGYSHDAQCVVYSGPDARYTGRELCFGYNENRLVVFDVTDKSTVAQDSSSAITSAVVLSSTPYQGNAYAHQGWLTEDQRYLLLDDELDEQARPERTKTYLFDMESVTEPKFIGVSRAPEVAIDHNLYVLGNKAYMTNYRSGLRVNDLTPMLENESQLTEVAYFDTVPGTDSTAEFGGAWSSYIYFPSGNIAINDISNGLFMVREQQPSSATQTPTASPVVSPDGATTSPSASPSTSPIASSSASPTASPSASPSASPVTAGDNDESGGLSTFLIAGIAGGGAVVALGGAALAYRAATRKPSQAVQAKALANSPEYHL